jgi:hypothetical protein
MMDECRALARGSYQLPERGEANADLGRRRVMVDKP